MHDAGLPKNFPKHVQKGRVPLRSVHRPTTIGGTVRSTFWPTMGFLPKRAGSLIEELPPQHQPLYRWNTIQPL